MLLAIILLVQSVLLQDIVRVEFNEGFQLRYHPCQSDIRNLLIRVTSTDVGMDAWEPNLF